MELAKLKNLFSIILVVLLLGCSSTPQFIPVPHIDSIYVHDTIPLYDTGDVWIGGIYSGKDSIGSIAVSPKSKTAVVDIKWLKPDTLIVPIESTKYLILTGFLERMITTFFSAMPFYWQILLILLLIALLFVVFKLWKKPNRSDNLFNAEK
jgi:hypothetical protein